ncbi:MAG: AI-2E family transporter [Deltaproteobacteria bacterium]|nr:AI-2E family transporter [Deltaproteobacteria bacterium]
MIRPQWVQGAPQNQDLAQILRMVRWLLICLLVVLGWVVLSYLAGVLGPILAALGIAYLLNPLLDRLVKRGMNRAAGAGILLGLALGSFIVLISIATPAIANQLGDFVGRLDETLANLDRWLKDTLGFEIPQQWRDYVGGKDVKGALAASSPMQRISEIAFSGIAGVIGVLAEVLLVPVFAFYFLVDWPNLLKRIEHMIPPRRRAEVRELVREIDRVIANWVRGQAIVTTILMILYAIAFTIVGMPLSVPIGFVVGALTIIPFIGTFVGAALAVLVVITGGGNVSILGGVGIVFVVLHLLEAAVLTPKIVGHRVGLSESGALLAVVAGGKLLGFVGVVLAVPIAATFAVLARYFVRYYQHTDFFGRESDADVVITPAMALIIPGKSWAPAVWEAGAVELETHTEIALEGDLAVPKAEP